ncbi:RHS repeat-associated core domain-containing protein [Burkholderia gladioli pv. gladioli]|uniref:RHS repeat-associated core domain-containing protein n=1 Tax=Burkholderia gladioli TaxID=28095 RepID=UPI0024BD237F|nr:RHS repeat-associated core domain-containing protein [Burkholderia gladioli]MDJ1162765.1 RHS repeat-associated core domain-containing protein [Burkholderia gladioli pv. gladioli]
MSDSTTPTYQEPSGSAEQRVANLQTLEDGEKTKQQQMGWVDGANYGMAGADIGYAAYAGGSAALAGGAGGAAALGAGALAAAPAVIALGGAMLLDKVGVTGAMASGFTRLGDALGLTIGRGDPHPACVGDDIAHSSGFWGMMVGLAVGVAIGAAIAATVATGGLAGALIVGCVMAGGLSLGSALAQASQSMGSNCGKIMTGSRTVYFEKKKVARVTDLVQCEHHSGVPEPLVEGSRTIFVNGLPLVRIGHETHCSGKVNSGCNSIWIDKTTGQYGPKNPELTAGQEFLAGLLGGLIGAKLGHMAGERFRPSSTESVEQTGVDENKRTCEKDPVDVASGELVERRRDLYIPGVLPLELARRYRTRATGHGLLGERWTDNWSQRLTRDGRVVRFHDGAGLVLGFDAPASAFDGINLREPRYRLVGSCTEPRILDRDTRRLLIFAELSEVGAARLERIEDLDGNAIRFGYDEQGRLAELAHSDGYRVALHYHGEQRYPLAIVLHDADGIVHRLVDYVHQGGRLVEVASRQFGGFRYDYDDNGWMTRWRDTDQTEVHYRYDRDGRVIETGTREGYHGGRFVYEPGRTRVIDADGESIYDHDADGLVVAHRNALGATERYEWELGRLSARIDPLGRRTDYRYDARGQLVGVIEASGRAMAFEHDEEQRLVAVVLPSGGRIRLEYDHLRRLIARTEPDGTRTQYRYGSRGELLRVVRGTAETRFDYDARLRPSEVVLASGARFRREVDVFGRLLAETSPDGQLTRFDYTPGPDNPRGLLRAVTRADGSVLSARYNSEGLAIEQVDPLGRVIRRRYGPFDLLTASIDAAGQETRYEYDHRTCLSRVTNPLGETWTYDYDAAGRLRSEIDWGGRLTRYRRDAAGRLLARGLPDGTEWRYSYDALDRITAIDAGDVRIVYRYDAGGRLASAEVQGEHPHLTRFAYDAHGRLIGEDQHGDLLRHVYDESGRRCLRATPTRETVYAYDPLGALTRVGGLEIERDGLGREIGRHAGAFVARVEYDVCGRIRKQVAGPEELLAMLQTDPAGAIEQLTRQVYRYDAAGELAGIDTEADTIDYRRDVRGQVTAVDAARQPAERYGYDAAMNLGAHGEQDTGEAHRHAPGGLPERVGYARWRYDARGRAIEKTVERPGFRPRTWRYDWDGLNRLVKVSTPDHGVWTYRYDAFNRRVDKRRVGARESTRYLWDGPALAERWTELRDGTTGEVVTWHIDPGSFRPLAQETDDGLYPVLTDQVGMPKAIFDARGERVWKGAHSLWGRLLARPAANDEAGTLDTTLRFPGQWADQESGLSYNLNRYYDPDSGQYLSPDPLGLAGGLRTQGYVENPTGRIDPLGLSGCEEFDVNKVTAKDIPTFASGKFNEWFDARTPEEISTMYEQPALRAKIESGLRGAGGNHEMLMVAEAPQWKQWDVSAKQVQEDFAIPISDLNEGGLANGWKHSTGLPNSKAPGSKMVHNQLQSIIQNSSSLSDFKQNIRPWADKWITGGYDALPSGFHQ